MDNISERYKGSRCYSYCYDEVQRDKNSGALGRYCQTGFRGLDFNTTFQHRRRELPGGGGFIIRKKVAASLTLCAFVSPHEVLVLRGPACCFAVLINQRLSISYGEDA